VGLPAKKPTRNVQRLGKNLASNPQPEAAPGRGLTCSFLKNDRKLAGPHSQTGAYARRLPVFVCPTSPEALLEMPGTSAGRDKTRSRLATKRQLALVPKASPNAVQPAPRPNR
jgi:hypothetical protein